MTDEEFQMENYPPEAFGHDTDCSCYGCLERLTPCERCGYCGKVEVNHKCHLPSIEEMSGLLSHHYSPTAPQDQSTATERARAWVQKQTGRFELDNPLLEADIADLAAFLESEAPRIRADERKKAVREFVTRFKKNVGYLSHPVNVKLMIDRTVKEMMVEQMIKEMTEVD